MITNGSAFTQLSFALCLSSALTLAGCGSGSMAGSSGSPAVTLSANSLSFPNETPGGASPAQAVTLTNSGSATLDITGISVGANFQEIDDCGANLTAGAKCVVNVTFAPTTSGNLQANLAIADDAAGSPQTVSLSGTGVTTGPPPATLTGYCFGAVQKGAPQQCGVVQDLTDCPVGQAAVQPTFVVGCLPPTSQSVDTSTSCQGTTRTGFTVKGRCVVAE